MNANVLQSFLKLVPHKSKFCRITLIYFLNRVGKKIQKFSSLRENKEQKTLCLFLPLSLSLSRSLFHTHKYTHTLFILSVFFYPLLFVSPFYSLVPLRSILYSQTGCAQLQPLKPYNSVRCWHEVVLRRPLLKWQHKMRFIYYFAFFLIYLVLSLFISLASSYTHTHKHCRYLTRIFKSRRKKEIRRKKRFSKWFCRLLSWRFCWRWMPLLKVMQIVSLPFYRSHGNKNGKNCCLFDELRIYFEMFSTLIVFSTFCVSRYPLCSVFQPGFSGTHRFSQFYTGFRENPQINSIFSI